MDLSEAGVSRSDQILSHRELRVYRHSFGLAMRLFALSKSFPRHERYLLVDQMVRSSRSVCANLGEAWRKRRYRAAFVAKLSDAEAEAGETQVWLEIAAASNYISVQESDELAREYEVVIAMIVRMIQQPEKWVIPPKP